MAKTRRAKQRKRTRARREARGETPLSAEEILQRENIGASAAMPSEIGGHLTTRRLLISGIRVPIAPQRSGKSARSYEIVIPKNAVVGLPGKTAYRIARPRGQARRQTVLEGFRPRWVDHVYHPKRAVVPRWAQRPRSCRRQEGRSLLWRFSA
jgi:hypothetical protein